MPDNPKTREKIMKKQKLEEDIINISKQINKLKVELKEQINQAKD